MKTPRSFAICFLVIFNGCILSGCATTSQESAASPAPSPTEDMNWIQKTGYYLWEPFQSIAYGMAAGNPSFTP